MKKPGQQDKILDLYSSQVSFIDIHHYICRILSGAECTLQDIEQWEYQIPFHIENCQLVLTGISQNYAQEKYGWNQNDQLNCFAFFYRPSIKKILEKGGYKGDSYIFLYDKEKYFITLFSPEIKAVKITPKDIAAQIHQTLKDYYENSFLKNNKEYRNFTILSDQITSKKELADSYAVLHEEKKTMLFYSSGKDSDTGLVHHKQKAVSSH